MECENAVSVNLPSRVVLNTAKIVNTGSNPIPCLTLYSDHFDSLQVGSGWVNERSLYKWDCTREFTEPMDISRRLFNGEWHIDFPHLDEPVQYPIHFYMKVRFSCYPL